MTESTSVDPKEWIVLSEPASSSEAQIIRATLGFAGIPAMVYGETGIGSAFGLLGDGVPTAVKMQVMVPAERLAEARQVIEAARAAGESAQADAAVAAESETIDAAVADVPTAPAV